jgi:hypothetical protein
MRLRVDDVSTSETGSLRGRRPRRVRALGFGSEDLRLELIRAGLIPRDEGQAPYEAGPPISPLHS